MTSPVKAMNIDDVEHEVYASSDSSDDEHSNSEALAVKRYVLEKAEKRRSARQERNSRREAQLEAVLFDRFELSEKKSSKKDPVEDDATNLESGGLFFFEDRQPEGKPADEPAAGTRPQASAQRAAKRNAAWADEDDLDESSKDFKQLRRRFEDAYGHNVSWATTAKESASKRSKRAALSGKAKLKRGRKETQEAVNEEEEKPDSESGSSSDDSEAEFEHETACRTFVRKPTMLQKGTLQYDRMRDVNKECELRGRLSAVEFHTKLPLALVAAESSCAFGLFRVDGRRNEKLHTAYLDGFGVTCAHFNVNSNEVLLGSRRKNFYVYDMPSGRLTDISTMNAGQSRYRERNVSSTTESFEVSPSGQYIVFMDGSQLHIVSARTKEWLGQLRAPSRVQAIVFGSNEAGRNETLFAIGTDGTVSMWDVATRRCIHSFTDSGCVRASAVCVSRSGALLATGHSTGIVNVYDTAQCLSSRTPSPLCTVQNLVTRCTALRFNATDELLCVASNRVRQGVRLLHVPTRSVFSNFPPMAEAALAHVEALDFSPASGYLSLATSSGKALLYRVKHYRDY